MRVSVVIPVKNDSRALASCLAALAAQTVAPDEVIVVDNASTDDSGDVAAAWGARVLYEAEPGIPAASTTGYDACRFDVIARLDADSVPPPRWIENGLARLEKEPGVDAVTGPGRFYDGPARGSRMLGALYMGAYFHSMRLALATVPLFGSTFFLRRSVWREVRGSVHCWGTDLHDDVDLSIHLTPRFTIVYDTAVWVGISSRPLTDWRTFAYRMHRGFQTLALHWPASSSVLRWRHVLLRSLAAPTSR
ncbi:glycosyltransferase family 2 protein [Subtercola sp. RTI3]|uniref:glycosyltransferase family 2 protein n=1 Tax=Subtercola sp. RTI3 TaxID=3048639 RepID=UPI002B22576F|nr:glycosyltransferase family 2 protein [Subtercola sp. RTI3]MEA9984391.1 glycosyltransferase family 2 protein [Subtercola sp. RTI3]